MAQGSLDLDDQLCFALYAATHAITRLYRDRLDPLGLTYPQYLVLLALIQESPRSAGAISAALKLDPAAISPLLKRLESAGLIHRAREPEDERIVRVSLSQKGEALKYDLATVQQEVVCRTGLSDYEFAAMRAGLHELVTRLSVRDREATPAL